VKAMPVTIDPPSKNVCPHTCIEKEERKKNFNNNEKREKENKRKEVNSKRKER
jgi:hypothetical protein